MPNVGDVLPLPETRSEMLDLLRHRRSNLAKVMSGPGPDTKELADLLEIAARVPDHRKLTPWRFVVFTGDARSDFGQHIGAAFAKQNPEAPVDRTLFESGRFLRAPVIVGVISSPVECPRGTPEWEQVLSCGAACYNLLIAAQASGYAAQWLTEWYAYDVDVLDALGVRSPERVAGFIYIGSTDETPVERKRPDMEDIVQHWS